MLKSVSIGALDLMNLFKISKSEFELELVLVAHSISRVSFFAGNRTMSPDLMTTTKQNSRTIEQLGGRLSIKSCKSNLMVVLKLRRPFNTFHLIQHI